MRCKHRLGAIGTAALALALAAGPAQAVNNPGGWIQNRGWNIVGPLNNPYGCGPSNAVIASQWLGPNVLGAIDFHEGDTFDGSAFPAIDFGAGLSNGFNGGSLFPDPIAYTLDGVAGALGAPAIGDNDVLDMQGFVDWWAANVSFAGNPFGATGLNGDNVMYVATTYVDNTSGDFLSVDICSASDDSIGVYVNNCLVTNVSACRGTAGGCAEKRPATLPPGVSRITVMVWEGGGGWGHRLGVALSGGGNLNDTTGPAAGLTFLGAGNDNTVGQEQFCTNRAIAGIRPDRCDTQNRVTISGSGPGNEADALTVEESVFAGDAEALVISDISDGGTVADILPPPPPAPIPVGKFGDHRVIGFPAEGPGSNTIDLGGDQYQSLAQTGTDIWDGGDGFEYAYNRFRGDFDISIRFDAEVNSGGGRWGKYGLMARKELTTASAYVMMQSHYNTNDSIANDDARLAGRLVENAGGGMFEDGSGVRQPKYIRLKRAGAVVRGYVSGDVGVEGDPTNDALWAQVGRNYTYPNGTPKDLYVGFANSAHDSMGAAVADITFTVLACIGTDSPASVPLGKKITWSTTRGDLSSGGVSYTIGSNAGPRAGASLSGFISPNVGGVAGPSAVSLLNPPSVPGGGKFSAHSDIGTPNVAGFFTDNGGGSYTIGGTGGDIWDGGDHMHYAWGEVTGDFQATMRVTSASISPANARWGRFGIMARRTCDYDSKYSMACNPYRGEALGQEDPKRHQSRRDSIGTTRDRQIAPLDPPCYTQLQSGWMRLTRCGSYFYSEFADDVGGEPGTWCFAGGDTWQGGAPATMLVGVASSSHGSGPAGGNVPLVVEFDNYTCKPLSWVAKSCSPTNEVLYEENFDAGVPAGDYVSNNIDIPTETAAAGALVVAKDGVNGTASQAHLDVDGLSLGDIPVMYEFDLNLSNPDAGAPADGAAFQVTEGSFAASIGRNGAGGGGMGMLIGSHNYDPPGPRRKAFAIEFDTWDGGHGDDDPPGGYGGNAGGQRWHVGIDFNETNLSAQNQIEFGAGPTYDAFDIPGGTHTFVRYIPLDDDTSEISVWIKTNNEDPEAGPVLGRTLVGRAIGPRIAGEAYLTVAAGTGGANHGTSIDNLKITQLCCENGDSVVIDQGPGPIDAGVGDTVDLSATVDDGGDGSGDSIQWSVSGPGAFVGGDTGASVQVQATGVGAIVVTAAYQDGTCNGDPATASVTINAVQLGGRQPPMDWNQSGKGDISDAVAMLNHLFSGGPAPPCGDNSILDAANLALLDANGSGVIDISDAVRYLGFLFLGAAPPVMCTDPACLDCILIPDCPDICP